MALYFVPIKDFGTSNPIVELKWENLNIPLTNDLDHLRYYNIKTFSTLTSKKEDKDPVSGELYSGPGVAFDIANKFLASLCDSDQEKIAIALLFSHAEIQAGEPDGSDLDEVELKIGQILDQLDLETDICNKTELYIKAGNIPIDDFSAAGSRPQDSEDMTFQKEEAIVLTAITIFMKLICPVIGAFIHKYTGIIDNEFKESHARTILLPLHSRKYKDILIKLHHYITKLVSQKLKEDATAFYNGHTLPKASRHATDMIIIKRLVCVSLYKRDGNIIKYIASCGRGSTESDQKNLASTNSAKIIADPEGKDQDEGNQSRLEVESRQSGNTADMPIILNVITKKLCNELIKEYNFDTSLIDAVVAFHSTKILHINEISHYLLSMFYGSKLGGGASLLYLHANALIRLSVVLQFVFLKHKAYNLVNILTAEMNTNLRVAQPDDYIFLNSWTNLPPYSECKKILPSGFGTLEWNSKLRSIVNLLIEKEFIYNTSPILYEEMNLPISNGQLITNFNPLIYEILQFMKLVYLKGKIE